MPSEHKKTFWTIYEYQIVDRFRNDKGEKPQEKPEPADTVNGHEGDDQICGGFQTKKPRITPMIFLTKEERPNASLPGRLFIS